MHPEQFDFGWREYRYDETPDREGMPDFNYGYKHPVTGIQVYPVAYLEFIQGEDGKRRRIGPMGEKEEMSVRDAWQVGGPPSDRWESILTVWSLLT